MTLAYVYKWTHIPSKRWYVGSRTAENCHPSDGYICSSPKIKEMIISNSSEWEREIISTGTQKEMYDLETEILQLFDARNDDRSFNLHNNDGVYVLWGDNHPNKKPENAKKISDALTGVPKSSESVMKMAKSLRELGDHHPSKRMSVRESKRKKMLDKGVDHHQKSPEARKAASERVSGDKHPMKGKHHTDNSKHLISVNTPRRCGSQNHRSRSIHTPFGEFDSISSAAKKLKIPSSTIGHRVRSKSTQFEEYYYCKHKGK